MVLAWGESHVSGLFESVADLQEGEGILQRRRYGVIEAERQEFRQVRLRPFPKLVFLPEIMWFGEWQHSHRAGDRCLLYFNQPWRYRNYLAVTYMVSARDTTLATVYRALEALDEVARIKGTDALLCDAANWRLSPAILGRLGWEPHCPSRWHRHYVKRFYGSYPPRPGWAATLSRNVR